VNDRKYGPKGRLSPTLGEPCAVCGVAFLVGDYTTLVRSTDGTRYADDGVEVHWDCAHPLAPKLADAVAAAS
jgi:hypothetical protein